MCATKSYLDILWTEEESIQHKSTYRQILTQQCGSAALDTTRGNGAS